MNPDKDQAFTVEWEYRLRSVASGSNIPVLASVYFITLKGLRAR